MKSGGGDIAALEATLVENTTHLPADEFQQYEVFARLAAKGESVTAIAERFGDHQVDGAPGAGARFAHR